MLKQSAVVNDRMKRLIRQKTSCTFILLLSKDVDMWAFYPFNSNAAGIPRPGDLTSMRMKHELKPAEDFLQLCPTMSDMCLPGHISDMETRAVFLCVSLLQAQGHTHALCGVSIVPGTPQILSADAGCSVCAA